MGQAILFVCILAAVLVVTPFVFLHLSHIYLTVLTRSSSGEDRINWPRESFYDWFPEGLLILGVVFFSGGLSLAIAGPLALATSAESGVVVWLIVLWLMLPVCLCSMLAAPSKLMVIYPPLLIGLARHWPGTLFVHALNLPLAAAAGAGVWLMARGNIGGVVVLSLALPFTLLLHGRSWGRLVWLALNYEGPRKKRKKKKKLPVDEAIEVDLEAIDEETDGYGVTGAAPTGERLVTLTEHYDQQMAYDRKIRLRTGDSRPDPLDGPESPTPGTALGQKILPFLGYQESLGACVSLAISCGIELLLIHLVLTFFRAV